MAHYACFSPHLRVGFLLLGLSRRLRRLLLPRRLRLHLLFPCSHALLSLTHTHHSVTHHHSRTTHLLTPSHAHTHTQHITAQSSLRVGSTYSVSRTHTHTHTRTHHSVTFIITHAPLTYSVSRTHTHTEHTSHHRARTHIAHITTQSSLRVGRCSACVVCAGSCSMARFALADARSGGSLRVGMQVALDRSRARAWGGGSLCVGRRSFFV